MLLEFMADKYGLKPQEFADTVRKTCGLPTASNEEFAAFLMVAREYNLNPMLREIYAFPKQGGGIVPIVSIDGWVNLINSHKALDGITFEMQHGENNELLACTCRIYRKDRTHPIEVTEYYDECKRDTIPWKMKHRMLRHKSLIQCARYAFGFSGIYDEDEGVVIAQSPMRDITPPTPPRPTSAPPRPNGSAPPAGAPAKQQPPKPANDQQSELAGKQIEDAEIDDEIPSFDHDPETGEVVEDEAEEEAKTPSQLLDALEADMDGAKDEISVREFWEAHDIEASLTHVERGDEFVAIARAMRDRALKRVRK
ncbi:recombinase RecT [Mesorhizobium sp. B2-1-2]|uniref:recombinase RecT n=1 Tax=Mesorhizobium sp. B2-1-2 TaxID=2589973 RepID=UPI00112DD61A|nr:recombinase RecT [Mesorhizobium sp. B2-1-2]TPN11676.1 recombinase [Mesorhizobium sp. B2-1-2]